MNTTKNTILVYASILLLSGCIVTPQEKERMQMDIANVKKELELCSKGLNSVSENIKKEKADIVASIDRIREEMAFLKGRFEESKFEAQKAREALEAVQARTTIDQKDVTARFSAIQTILASMEKNLSSEGERLKGIEERVSLIEKEIQEEKALFEGAKKTELKEEKGEEILEPPKPEALYAQGFQQIKDKDFSKAIETFKRFISLFPEHDLADNAQYWIGEAYYAEKEYERAVIELNEVIKKYPKGDKAAASMVKQGMAFYELGNKKEAKHILERVRTKYPNTEEANIAKKKMEEMK